LLDTGEQALCIWPVHEQDRFGWTNLVSVELAQATLGNDLDVLAITRK